jgi:hypothetical protein
MLAALRLIYLVAGDIEIQIYRIRLLNLLQHVSKLCWHVWVEKPDYISNSAINARTVCVS